MKVHRNISSRYSVDNGRPDYYITPTRDFTQYTKDYEEKYWSKDTKFNWDQSVADNLKAHLEKLSPDAFSHIIFMVLPMVEDTVTQKIIQVQERRLPLGEDAIKDIAECITHDKPAIHQALILQSPLSQFQLSVSQLNDQLEILNNEFRELKDQQKIGYFKKGNHVKPIETEAEKQEQLLELSRLSNRLLKVKNKFNKLNVRFNPEFEKIKAKIKIALKTIETQVLVDLKDSQTLIRRTIQTRHLPTDVMELSRLKDLVLKRQLRGLKDIANHALVVEQSAIAPLSMGIIHYKRYREIQEAMTTFLNDEAKHSATFRRFLVEKLEAKEYISGKLIKGATRYMWLSRFMPGAGLFLAVIVEAIGAAYLEFFGEEKYMPDPLFCSISKTISVQDETRHMDLCVAMYNELFREGKRWEGLRNKVALTVMLKSVYGDKNEDHHLIQAFRAFGVESETLYRHITNRLSQQLARIGMYVTPEKLLKIIGINNQMPK